MQLNHPYYTLDSTHTIVRQHPISTKVYFFIINHGGKEIGDNIFYVILK